METALSCDGFDRDRLMGTLKRVALLSNERSRAPSPPAVARDSARRATDPPGVRAVLRHRLLRAGNGRHPGAIGNFMSIIVLDDVGAGRGHSGSVSFVSSISHS